MGGPALQSAASSLLQLDASRMVRYAWAVAGHAGLLQVAEGVPEIRRAGCGYHHLAREHPPAFFWDFVYVFCPVFLILGGFIFIC